MILPFLVQNNSRMQRYELPINGDAMAMAYYRMEGHKVVLTHTEVPFEYSGAGIGTKLADGVFSLIRKSGLKLAIRLPRNCWMRWKAGSQWRTQ